MFIWNEIHVLLVQIDCRANVIIVFLVIWWVESKILAQKSIHSFSFDAFMNRYPRTQLFHLLPLEVEQPNDRENMLIQMLVRFTYKYACCIAKKQTHSYDYASLFWLIYLIFEVVYVYVENERAQEKKKHTQPNIVRQKRRKRQWWKSTKQTNSIEE